MKEGGGKTKDMKNELLFFDNVNKAGADLVRKKLPEILLQTIMMNHDLEDYVMVADLSSAPNTVGVMLIEDFVEKHAERLSEPMKLINRIKEDGTMPCAFISSCAVAIVGFGSLAELSRTRTVMEERFGGDYFDKLSSMVKEHCYENKERGMQLCVTFVSMLMNSIYGDGDILVESSMFV